MKEADVIKRRLGDLSMLCNDFNTALSEPLFVSSDCIVRSDRLKESKTFEAGAKKSGDEAALTAITDVMAFATGMEAAVQSLAKSSNSPALAASAGYSCSRVSRRCSSPICSVSAAGFRSWLLLESRKNHKAAFRKLKGELAKTRGSNGAISDQEFEAVSAQADRRSRAHPAHRGHAL